MTIKDFRDGIVKRAESMMAIFYSHMKEAGMPGILVGGLVTREELPEVGLFLVIGTCAPENVVAMKEEWAAVLDKYKPNDVSMEDNQVPDDRNIDHNGKHITRKKGLLN